MKIADIKLPILVHSFRRVSSKEQKDKGFSLPAQKKINEKRAKEDRLEINYHWEIDETASKGIGKERKKYKQFFQILKEGLGFYHIVLVEKYDRISRNENDRMEVKKLINAGQVEIRTEKPKGVIDSTQGAHENLAFKVHGAVSEYVSEYISEEVRKGHREKVERGEPLGRVPLGYKSIPKTKTSPQQIVQTADAPKVKKFLEMYSSGKFSLNQAVKLAKDLGLRSAEGYMINRASLTRVIKRRFYYGVFEWEGEIHQIKTQGFKPLIDKKTWEKNQRVLQKRSTVREGREKRFYTYNGLLTCGKCDRQFYGAQDQYPVKWKKKDGSVGKETYKYDPKYVCSYGPLFHSEKGIQIDKEFIDKRTLTVKEDFYRTYDAQLKDGEWKEKKNRIARKGDIVLESKCRAPSLPEERITNYLLEQMSMLKFNSAVWKKLKGQLWADETKDFIDEEIQILRAERTKLEKERKAFAKAWAEGKLDDDLFNSLQGESKTRLTEIDQTLTELSAQSDDFEEKIGQSIKIIDALRTFKTKWQRAEDEKKNLIIKLVTIKIWVDTEATPENSLKIEWTPEFNQLFELGIIERVKDEGQYGGGGSAPNDHFNGKKINNII